LFATTPIDRPSIRPNPQTIEGQNATVPTLYGQSTDQAARALRQAGFQPVVGPTVDSSNSVGTVAYLSPGSGGQAQTGSTVTIYVSDGTPYVAPQPAPQKKKGGDVGRGKGKKKPGPGAGKNR